MKQQKFSIRKRIKSFFFAITGLKVLFREEHNARIHLLALVLVIVAGLFFRISINEWITIIIVSGIVFLAELFNSAIEGICDFISPDKHQQIKKIKDYAAAAVLISALAAMVTGALIFLPKIF